jgi:flagellar assembly protein FliH
MGATSKFLFDRTFDDASGVLDDEDDRYAKRHTKVELAAARAEGVEEGRQAGHAAAMSSIEAQAARAMDAATRELTALGAGRAEARKAVMEAGLELAAAIARKAMPELARRNGLAEVEALVADCLGQLVDEPRVVIRVNDALLDALEGRTQALARQAGFEGKLVLLADAALGPGDCRVEWADGGVVRNLARLLDELDTTVQRALGRSPVQAESQSTAT